LLGSGNAAVAGMHERIDARAVVPGGTWETAEEVPGAAQLNQDGAGQLNSVSCGSAGNCSAGGYYKDSSGHYQAFVISQVHGTWHSAKEVPGTAALNQGGHAAIKSVSCASAGNCIAGGHYTDSSGHDQALVVSEVNGTWGTAIEVPGTAALDQGGGADTTSVSCASAGNCTAGGDYGAQVFVDSEVNGTWGTAIEVPGTAALNQGGEASTISVSCGSAGNCTAGGFYADSTSHEQAFVDSQVNGTWGTAIEVPGTAALNQGGEANTISVSCASAGNCTAGGFYALKSFGEQPFVINQVNGTWGTAIEVPGIAALNPHGGFGGVSSMSCASAGNCTATGGYVDSSDEDQTFVDSQVHGTWGTPIKMPRQNKAGLNPVSCASAGNCVAGGAYADSTGRAQALVVSQVNGTWGRAIEVPGTAALNQGGDAEITLVSCASVGNCTAGGHYLDRSLHEQAFVDSEVHGTWGTAIEVHG
jgi:hypothetical protein